MFDWVLIAPLNIVVSFIGKPVNNDSTLYDTSSLPYKGGIEEYSISGHFCTSSIE